MVGGIYPFRFTKLQLNSILRTNTIKTLDPKDFYKTNFLTKDVYIAKKIPSKNQIKLNYQHTPFMLFKTKKTFANKKPFYPKNKYYNAVMNDRPLTNYFQYIYTTEMAKERDIFLNSLALNHKYLYQCISNF